MKETDLLVRDLTVARDRTLQLTDLDEPELLRQHDPLMSPLIWDLAHIGQQEDLWLLRGGEAGRPGVLPVAVEALYDAFTHPRAVRAGLPLLPGVATPSEVQLAVSLGLTWVKAFPATWLGPGWFTHLRGPFPQVSFVATGGLDAGNAQDYLDAGVRVAAVGSALEDPTQLERLSALLTRV